MWQCFLTLTPLLKMLPALPHLIVPRKSSRFVYTDCHELPEKRKSVDSDNRIHHLFVRLSYVLREYFLMNR